jgi:ABC-type Mn2+/Zn2+ transport system permease subunit
VSWPHFVKLINGLSWALPFVFIPLFQKDYPFLLLTGISAGNLSTFIFLRRYSHITNIEQIVTGVVLLSSLIGIIILYYGYSLNYEALLITSRIFISLSYGIGGIVGYIKNK